MATVTVQTREPAPPPIEKVTLEMSYAEATYLRAIIGVYTPNKEAYLPQEPMPRVLQIMSIHNALKGAAIPPGGSWDSRTKS